MMNGISEKMSIRDFSIKASSKTLGDSGATGLDASIEECTLTLELDRVEYAEYLNTVAPAIMELSAKLR